MCTQKKEKACKEDIRNMLYATSEQNSVHAEQNYCIQSALLKKCDYLDMFKVEAQLCRVCVSGNIAAAASM